MSSWLSSGTSFFQEASAVAKKFFQTSRSSWYRRGLSLIPESSRILILNPESSDEILSNISLIQSRCISFSMLFADAAEASRMASELCNSNMSLSSSTDVQASVHAGTISTHRKLYDHLLVVDAFEYMRDTPERLCELLRDREIGRVVLVQPIREIAGMVDSFLARINAGMTSVMEGDLDDVLSKAQLIVEREEILERSNAVTGSFCIKLIEARYRGYTNTQMNLQEAMG